MVSGNNTVGEEKDGPGGKKMPLLVVVDMQVAFAPGGAWEVPGFKDLEEPVGKLIAAVGLENICFTRFTLPDKLEGSWKAYYEKYDFMLKPESAPLLDLAEPYKSLSEGEGPSGRKPHIIELHTMSKWGPEMKRLVQDHGNTVLVTGVATGCCVISTVLGAVDGGAYVRLVDDGCKGCDPEGHKNAVEVCRGFAPQVHITTVDAEIQELQKHGLRQQAMEWGKCSC